MKRAFLIMAVLGIAAFAAFVWSTSIRCGFGKAINKDELTPALEACAAKGNTRALFWQAILKIIEADTTAGENRAMGLMIKAAEAGSSEAMNEVGLAYLTGDFGLEQDYEKAREWLERATEEGDKLAPVNLARVYAGGYGVEQDLEKALAYVKLSASRGYRNSRCVLYVLELVDNDVGPVTYYMLGYNRCNVRMVPDELFALAPDVIEEKYPWVLEEGPYYPINRSD